MADDVDAPHEREVGVPSFADPVELVGHMLDYLPHVGGRGHSWGCTVNGRLVATIQGNGVRVDAETQEVRYEEENDVHFAYSSAPW